MPAAEPRPPRIQDLKHRVALCRQQDIVADGKTMELHRAEVVWTWGRISTFFNTGSFMDAQGHAILDVYGPNRLMSHNITVRRGLDVEFSAMAWIFEERRKGPPRWYKVLGFSDGPRWVYLQCKLMEKSDDVSPPHKMLMPQNSRVDL